MKFIDEVSKSFNLKYMSDQDLELEYSLCEDALFGVGGLMHRDIDSMEFPELHQNSLDIWTTKLSILQTEMLERQIKRS